MDKFSTTRTIKKENTINAYINWTNLMLGQYDLNYFDY